MKANELRQKYIEFFKSRDHAEISGKSLIPENDPTVLFTMAGMHPLVPYLLGQPHPAGTRLVNYQKCIRTGDIEDVGDPSHLTFFEMLGNWSLGDYFKEESITMSYEFLTDKEWLGISPDTLSVTVFAGNDLVPADDESANVWRSMGIPDSRIFYLPESDNWWSAGETGPCGPDTEMFIDTGRKPCGDDCRPGCSCGKYFEIWNNVFMQYNKKEDGTFEELERRCVDTGMGIERTITILQGKDSVYLTEAFLPLIETIAEISSSEYGKDEQTDRSMRIIADHAKTAAFILGDPQSVKPSNVGRGYVLRRLIRRAVREGRKLGVDTTFLAKPVEIVAEMYAGPYPEIQAAKRQITEEITAEEERFLKTLQKGEQELEKMLPNLLKNPKREVPGRVAFKLYDTYGFPIELTEELAAENEMTVDREGFDKAYKKHQELSKQSASKSFKGGLADTTEQTTRLHTATHLLHQALHDVLGDHVKQMGSNITPERLRFDFSHPEKMSDEEIKQVEEIVNERISEDLPVSIDTMTVDKAVEEGAFAFFNERYDEQVKVYSIGSYSKEVCGGPHVEHTGELGRFKITKEQSSSAGVRRIRAVLEPAGS